MGSFRILYLFILWGGGLAENQVVDSRPSRRGNNVQITYWWPLPRKWCIQSSSDLLLGATPSVLFGSACQPVRNVVLPKWCHCSEALACRKGGGVRLPALLHNSIRILQFCRLLPVWKCLAMHCASQPVQLLRFPIFGCGFWLYGIFA